MTPVISIAYANNVDNVILQAERDLPTLSLLLQLANAGLISRRRVLGKKSKEKKTDTLQLFVWLDYRWSFNDLLKIYKRKGDNFCI